MIMVIFMILLYYVVNLEFKFYFWKRNTPSDNFDFSDTLYIVVGILSTVLCIGMLSVTVVSIRKRLWVFPFLFHKFVILTCSKPLSNILGLLESLYTNIYVRYELNMIIISPSALKGFCFYLACNVIFFSEVD